MKPISIKKLLERFKKMFVFVDNKGKFIDRGPK
jgi:hypothetical protein